MNSRKIRSMIVEDEPEALDLLTGLLEATGEATVVASTTNPFEAIDLLLLHTPDILFLDIKMPGMSGFDIINEMNRLTALTPHVVFTTAHDEYAIKAFDCAAFDYLLKPIDPERLAETLHRHSSQTVRKKREQLQQQSFPNNEKILIFRGVTGVTFIDTDEVVYITADGNYSSFHFISGRIETVTSLIGNIEAQLGKQFFRTSRSCIINTSYLARIDMKQLSCVFIKGEKEFRCEISRDKVKMLTDFMKNRFFEL
ncbi:MAG TPA: LytTR family DNA-binding domain-containing protein [Bacteroidales bacterium]|jgi:two-component system LytT family response regulator|nr:response regulator transcription factor [Bacteroidales bacterium]MBP7037153.1 response regulator transcription factor [Bacteroidales bacterium]MBP8710408.1 response regulator transcription factor [Bacteroidales bacterium]MZQ79224.1 response regulator [Bacteroidales bacterium]HHU99665.1 response regulator transcription factor [Bacteroidales bacterium]